MRFPGAVLVLLLLVVGTADAATYRATFTATQELTWKVDGVTTDQCESRRGTGGGTVKLKVTTDRPSSLYAAGTKLNLLGSIVTTAKGSVTGRFTDSINAPCGDAPPGEAVTAETSGCGATKFGIHVELKPIGAFTYFTGPGTPLQTGSIAQSSGECPYLWTTSIARSNDLSACGDGRAQHQRSWGIAKSGGQGLFASRLSAAQTKPLRKGAKRTITGRTVVDCTVDSIYSGGVKLDGVLKYTLSLKRTS